MLRAMRLAGVSVGALLAATPSLAQIPGEAAPATQATRSTSYDAAFFTAYQPRNALEIARRVPGFTLDLGITQSANGSVDVRGFAGVAGNVVINGARPSSKAETLESLLARIPAQRVTRVEVGPGDLYGSDYASKSQVLNILLSSASGFDGNATGSGRRLFTGDFVPNLNASTIVQRGPSSFNFSAGTGRTDYVEEGSDTVSSPEGDEREFRRKVNTIKPHDPFVAGSWALERDESDAIRVNARYGPSTFYLTQANRVTTADGEVRDDRLVQDYKIPAFELGGDITRPLAEGAVKLVGLATRRKRDRSETYFVRNEGGDQVLGGSEQIDKARRNETIGRLSWTRGDLMGFSFEAGAEVAWNTLKSNLDLFEFGPDGERTPIDLPIQDATVRELRGEAYVKAGRQLSQALRADVGLNYEQSRLKVRGDATADRSLKFLKPSMTLDWNSGGWHAQLIARRTVAQLDFYDFISAAELSTGRVNGGNANLLPQRAWEGRAVLEHALLGRGKARLELGYDRIGLLQDRILVFDDNGKPFDAPGNIGTGKSRFATLTLDAPLDRLGLNGFQLKFLGTLRRTRVEDPISHEQRDFSGFFPNYEWQVELRRDAGRFAYGATVQNRDKITFFRTDEFDINYNSGAFGSAFVEYRANDRTSLTLDVENLFNTGGARKRIFFDPNRTNPDPVEREIRERNNHLSIGLTVKRSFGRGSAAAPAS